MAGKPQSKPVPQSKTKSKTGDRRRRTVKKKPTPAKASARTRTSAAKKLAVKEEATQCATPAPQVALSHEDELRLRMLHQHTPIRIAPMSGQSDFIVTQDLRATSDELWQHLYKFRSMLIGGGEYTPVQWVTALFNIREHAYPTGLRPSTCSIGLIAASLHEAIEGDPNGRWDNELGQGTMIVLYAAGSAGSISCPDLDDGFTDLSKRVHAIEWAESWMNARERQLCATTTLAAGASASNEGDVLSGTRSTFPFQDIDLTILTEIGARDRLITARELVKSSGMPKYVTLTQRLKQMECADPPLVERPRGKRGGYAVTRLAQSELEVRDLG